MLHNPFRSDFGLAGHSENGHTPRVVTEFCSSVKEDFMERVEKALKLTKKRFKRIIGTTKNRPLTEGEKAYNKELSRRRVFIENINARIKVFKIMAYPYRNQRSRHLLRTKLICAILNAEKTGVAQVMEQVWYFTLDSGLRFLIS